MAYVDEILFGREVEQQLPRLVQKWVEKLSHPPENHL